MATNQTPGMEDGPDSSATTSTTGAATPNTTPTSTSTTPPSTSSPTADRVTGMLSAGNPYIEQAKSAGMDVANSRGLLNSSIAAGASQKAAYDAAVPIATNDANIQSAATLQGGQIASTEKIATANNVTQTAIAGMNIDASAKQQAAAILSQEKISAASLTNQADIAKLQSDTQQSIAALNISDADKQQLLSLAAQQRLADTQQSTSLQVANMNVSSDQQDKAAAAALGYAQNYSSMVNAINNNTQIPADARAAYLQNAKTLYDNGMSLVEQTYNVSLSWGDQSTASGASGGYAPPQAAPTSQTQLDKQNNATAANYSGTGNFPALPGYSQ